MTPPLSDHQADQLDRLRSILTRYPAMDGRYAVVYRQGVREDDVPEVYRQLRDLGLVTITCSDSLGHIALVRDDEAA